MTALDAAHHAPHHHKAPVHHCGLAIWCHTAPAQAKQDAMVGHYAAAILGLVILLAVLIVVMRWRGKRKSARSRRRPTTTGYPGY